MENKDRYLEGRWYFDEWDKTLAVWAEKQQENNTVCEKIIIVVLALLLGICLQIYNQTILSEIQLAGG